MIIINFTHPITDSQKEKLEELAHQDVDHIVEVPSQFGEDKPYTIQANALVDAAGLSPLDWQTLPIVVALPSLNIIAALVLAEIHGRAGHFPAIIRMRPAQGAPVRQFEVAEILDLQRVRDEARDSRTRY